MRLAGTVAALTVLLATATASATSSAVTRGTSGALYSPRAVYNCLSHKQPGTHAMGFVRMNTAPRKYFPPGMTWHISDLAIYGPKLDPIGLYFFKSDALAQAGESKLVDSLIFGKGNAGNLGKLISVIAPPPPTEAAARDLHRVTGNVVILWNYPRRHVAASDRQVNTCLAASRQ